MQQKRYVIPLSHAAFEYREIASVPQRHSHNAKLLRGGLPRARRQKARSGNEPYNLTVAKPNSATLPPGTRQLTTKHESGSLSVHRSLFTVHFIDPLYMPQKSCNDSVAHNTYFPALYTPKPPSLSFNFTLFLYNIE